MSENNSLKRDNEEMDKEENQDNDLNPPESKQSKVDSEISEPNLENDEVNNKNDANQYEISSKTTIVNENETKSVVNGSEVTINSKIEISTESSIIEDTIPCSITIKFHDNATAELYKSQFIDFLNTFTEFHVENDDLSLNIYKVDNPNQTPSKKRKKRSKVKKELFVVDATPSPATVQSDLRYTTKFTINTEKIDEEEVRISVKSMCFNCDGDHALRECPHPKNHAKINEARQKFNKGQNKSSRYHLEPDQKFSHLKPGQISNELRKALGLHRNEAPEYIYQMRRLGYPPGWLEEAKIVNSNLNMYGIDGNVKNAPSVSKKGGLDESKIIEYPGFNVPFQKGVKDDYRRYSVPPFSENFNKNMMIDFYHKQFSHEQDNLETCDMDIDSEQQPEDEKTRDSPSLVDLEQQKLQLLEELNEEPKKESDKELSAVKTSCFGTPILKSSTPYSKLPDPDNFSKNVSPVIAFENLPNSTGKYEQLTNVLQKVRSTMKKMNSDSNDST